LIVLGGNARHIQLPGLTVSHMAADVKLPASGEDGRIVAIDNRFSRLRIKSQNIQQSSKLICSLLRRQ
jgi:hypothetical protein